MGYPLAVHALEVRGELPRHGHARDADVPPALNPLVPLSQLLVFVQHLEDQLGQQPTGHAAARFGDPAQPLARLAAVAVTGREPPVVGQAACTREALHATDATSQGRRSKLSRARSRCQAGTSRRLDRDWRTRTVQSLVRALAGGVLAFEDTKARTVDEAKTALERGIAEQRADLSSGRQTAPQGTTTERRGCHRREQRYRCGVNRARVTPTARAVASTWTARLSEALRVRSRSTLPAD